VREEMGIPQILRVFEIIVIIFDLIANSSASLDPPDTRTQQCGITAKYF